VSLLEAISITPGRWEGNLANVKEGKGPMHSNRSSRRKPMRRISFNVCYNTERQRGLGPHSLSGVTLQERSVGQQ
jgi:hypothetical protein